ncbi:MAG TPA: hypothetical protein VL992_16260 [Tepidisphaeraceae bacterium]|nr:hypothetical protein [Tepidisphaeraceae bacterium]
MHVVIFEGQNWPSFAPVSLSRPVFMLRCGLGTLLDQSIRTLKPKRLTLWVRPGLAEYCRREIVPTLKVPTEVNKPLDDEPAMISSGRCVHLQPYEYPNEQSIVLDESNLIRQAFVQSPGLSPEDVMRRTPAWMKFRDLPAAPPQSRLPQYLWDLTNWNEEAIVADAIDLHGKAAAHPAGPYHLVNPENIHLDKAVTIEPGVVLDASKGPIVVQSHVRLGANSVIQGPCFIGSYTQVASVAYIRPGCTIGPGCKVGGEIASSIILGNSNKVHEGYLGDSYLGEWVNLGAGTTTSNLKNTYGRITMRIGEQEIKTDRRFLGSMIGDHTKTAIGTRLMSGTYIGYCTLIASSAIPPRFVPSFTYLTDKGTEKYRLDKAADMMTQVFGRRGINWTDLDRELVEYVAKTAGDVEGT